MTNNANRPTVKQVRAEIERLGVTEDLAGMSIEDLIRTAREREDPLAFVAALKTETAASESESPTAEFPIESAPPAADPAGEEENYDDRTPPEPFDSTVLPSAAAEERRYVTAALEIPLGELPMDQVRARKFHIARHLEVQLGFEQAVALRRLVAGLEA